MSAEAIHRPASQVVRDLMREFIQHQREAREYDEFLRRKVQTARAQRDAGLHFANEDVEAEFAVQRATLIRDADETDV